MSNANLAAHFPVLDNKKTKLLSLRVEKLNEPYPGEPDVVSKQAREALWTAHYGRSSVFKKNMKTLDILNENLFPIIYFLFVCVFVGITSVCILSSAPTSLKITKLILLVSLPLFLICLCGHITILPSHKFFKKLPTVSWEFHFRTAESLLRQKGYFAQSEFHEFIIFFNSINSQEPYLRVMPDDIVAMVELSEKLKKISEYSNVAKQNIILTKETSLLLLRVREAMEGYRVPTPAAPVFPDTRHDVYHNV